MKFRSLAFMGCPKLRLSRSGVLQRLRGDKYRGVPFRWVPVTARPDSNVVKKGTVPYLRVIVNGKRWLLHRLVLTVFRGPCPPGKEGRHVDGNHLNNRLSNLRWGTPKRNSMDKIAHGRSGKGKPKIKNAGSRNGRALFTDEQAASIRDAYVPKVVTYRMLANKHGCSVWAIMDIVNGRTY